MSEYCVVELEMNDDECIKLALQELGYVCEQHAEAQQLLGYEGSLRDNRAHIIIRKNHLGISSNDAGFLKKENGNYDLIISEYDKRTANGRKLTKNLIQIYGKHRFLKQVKRMGLKVKSQKVDADGKIKIKVMAT